MSDVFRELKDHQVVVQRLRALVYSRSDPAADEKLLKELAEAEKNLIELKLQMAAVPAPTQPELQPLVEVPHFLGQATTELEINTQILMEPLPTGIYHLLNPAKQPLLTVTVKNLAAESRRIRVSAYIEGLSARVVQTLELKSKKTALFKMYPTLLPERARLVTEVQWATLHVIVDILGNTKQDAAPNKQPYAELCESHNTFPILCLSRNSSFNATRDPTTGQTIDLSRYYAAWVTPYERSVQQCIRQAATLNKGGQMWGYQGNSAAVTRQVKALYEALKAADLTYVSSVLDYGTTERQMTQRTRLPRESLEFKSANCIDGTVLMASLLEGVSLNPAIRMVPGHAFVGWETGFETGEFEYLETTMIGTHDFKAACASGNKQHEKAAIFDDAEPLSIARLRSEGIFPME